ncbi:MAG: Uma2 family endonuclease [Candidatus Rokuibacteriota bacterium]|nr:MAG: Uma2 family endonuclease [Candidatus Rokubacteria bacterium]
MGGRRSLDEGGDEMAVMPERRRFTLEEYHRLGETGILGEDERVELVEGEIVKMTPIGWNHASVVARIATLFWARFGERTIVWVQNPLMLPRQVSEFQPDVALLKRRSDFYRGKPVEPDDALLVVEVMDSSVAYDRRVKLPIYARGSAPEVWLVDVNASTVEAHRSPTAAGYQDRRLVDRAGSITPLAFPDVTLPVVEIVG